MTSILHSDAEHTGTFPGNDGWLGSSVRQTTWTWSTTGVNETRTTPDTAGTRTPGSLTITGNYGQHYYVDYKADGTTNNNIFQFTQNETGGGIHRPITDPAEIAKIQPLIDQATAAFRTAAQTDTLTPPAPIEDAVVGGSVAASTVAKPTPGRVQAPTIPHGRLSYDAKTQRQQLAANRDALTATTEAEKAMRRLDTQLQTEFTADRSNRGSLRSFIVEGTGGHVRVDPVALQEALQATGHRDAAGKRVQIDGHIAHGTQEAIAGALAKAKSPAM